MNGGLVFSETNNINLKFGTFLQKRIHILKEYQKASGLTLANSFNFAYVSSY